MKFSKAEITDFMGDKDYLIVSVGNYGFFSMVKNYVKYLEKLNIKNYLIFALDKKLYNKLVKLNINTYLLETSEKLPIKSQPFRTIGFNKITETKILIIYELLKMNLNILFSDVDTVWLSNPMDYINIEEDFDMQIQNDTRTFEINTSLSTLEFNTGFYFVKSNKKTIQLFEKVLSKIREIPEMNDQHCFNAVIQNMRDRIILSTSNSASLIKDTTKLSIKILDILKFPNGNLYFLKNSDFTKFNIKPIIIHANFFSNIKLKIGALKKFNYWHF